jgi:hypothetical protein
MPFGMLSIVFMEMLSFQCEGHFQQSLKNNSAGQSFPAAHLSVKSIDTRNYRVDVIDV